MAAAACRSLDRLQDRRGRGRPATAVAQPSLRRLDGAMERWRGTNLRELWGDRARS